MEGVDEGVNVSLFRLILSQITLSLSTSPMTSACGFIFPEKFHFSLLTRDIVRIYLFIKKRSSAYLERKSFHIEFIGGNSR